jgi:uncharacterized protein YxeA
MKTIIAKVVVLICLTLLLGILLFRFQYSKNDYHFVTITEKYYSQDANGTAKGVKSGKVIKLSISPGDKEVCAMGFSNGKVFRLKCENYLDYTIGQKVYIEYQNDQLKDIRSKN